MGKKNRRVRREREQQESSADQSHVQENLNGRCCHLGNAVRLKVVKGLNRQNRLRHCEDCQKEASMATSDDEARTAVTGANNQEDRDASLCVCLKCGHLVKGSFNFEDYVIHLVCLINIDLNLGLCKKFHISTCT
jgi:hypothetical protein